MARIEAWEARIRGDMAKFVHRLNLAPGLAMRWHESEREKDPEHVAEVDPNAPGALAKLTEPARRLLLVSQAAKLAIAAEEEEPVDFDHLHKVMHPIVDFTDNMMVKMRWSFSEGQYHFDKVLESPEETHPLLVASLTLALDDYFNRNRDLVHLGVCRVCKTAYLKPKHGQKMRYCSPACRQKAYRKRHEEGAAKET